MLVRQCGVIDPCLLDHHRGPSNRIEKVLTVDIASRLCWILATGFWRRSSDSIISKMTSTAQSQRIRVEYPQEAEGRRIRGTVNCKKSKTKGVNVWSKPHISLHTHTHTFQGKDRKTLRWRSHKLYMWVLELVLIHLGVFEIISER